MAFKIPGFETEDGESDCDWLIFANAGDSVPREYKPTNGHNVFFADTPLIMVRGKTNLPVPLCS